MKLYRQFKIMIPLLAIGLMYHLLINPSNLHQSINLNDVESINIWGQTTRMANSDEKRDIVKWFNSITEICENIDFAGTTPEAGIVIRLKTGSEILILKSGTDFEVQRTNSLGKRISYWGKQVNIRSLLYKQLKAVTTHFSYFLCCDVFAGKYEFRRSVSMNFK